MARCAVIRLPVLALSLAATVSGCTAIVENKLADKADEECWGKDDGELCDPSTLPSGDYAHVCVEHFCEEVAQCGRVLDDLSAHCDCQSVCRAFEGYHACMPVPMSRFGTCRDDPEVPLPGMCNEAGVCSR